MTKIIVFSLGQLDLVFFTSDNLRYFLDLIDIKGDSDVGDIVMLVT